MLESGASPVLWPPEMDRDGDMAEVVAAVIPSILLRTARWRRVAVSPERDFSCVASMTRMRVGLR